MASTSETGHAKNVANFHHLITSCQGFGSIYNPTKESLKISSMLTQKANAQSAIAAVIPKNTAYNDIINQRAAAFADLKTFSTKVINALKVTETTAAKIADATAFNKKIQGIRATAIPAANPGTTPSTISTSQRSYDQLLQHFEGLLSVVQSESNYKPNEIELRKETLQLKLADMQQKNEAVSFFHVEVSNSRIERDSCLYHPQTGIVATAADVKTYVKSLYGTSSPQYAQIRGIQFRTVKR